VTPRLRPDRDEAGSPNVLYNTFDEVDVLVEMLDRIVRGDYRGTYVPRADSFEYVPVNGQDVSKPSTCGYWVTRAGV